MLEQGKIFKIPNSDIRHRVSTFLVLSSLRGNACMHACLPHCDCLSVHRSFLFVSIGLSLCVSLNYLSLNIFIWVCPFLRVLYYNALFCIDIHDYQELLTYLSSLVVSLSYMKVIFSTTNFLNLATLPHWP